MPPNKHSLARIGFNILANDPRTKFSTEAGSKQMMEILKGSEMSSIEALKHVAKAKMLPQKKDDGNSAKRLDNLE